MNELSSKTFNPGEGLERIEVRGKDIASLYPQPEGEMPEKLDWNSLSDAVNGEAKESVRAEVREHVDPALQEGLDTLKEVSATLTEMGELLHSLKESVGLSEPTREQLDSVAAKGETARQGINSFIDKFNGDVPEPARDVLEAVRGVSVKYTDYSTFENCVKNYQLGLTILGAVAGGVAGSLQGFATSHHIVGAVAGAVIGTMEGRSEGNDFGEFLGNLLCGR